MGEFRRTVVRTVKRTEEKSSTRGRSFSWRSIEVYTVTAECGHERELRGMCVRVPKAFDPCKACEAGEPSKPVEGPLGFIDQSDGTIRDPIARALIESQAR